MENFSLSDREPLARDKEEEEEEGGPCSPSRRGGTAVWSLLACLVSCVDQIPALQPLTIQGIVSLVGAIIGVIYAIVTASGENSVV